MKIYVIGSTSFAKGMVEAKNALIGLGLEGWIHQDYEDIAQGEKTDISKLTTSGEKADVKRANDYLRVHYRHICESDAVLVVNHEKDGINSYIGGNALIEMGQAYVNEKTIFLLNDIPTDVRYSAEIEAMDPICLHGELENIKKHQLIDALPRTQMPVVYE